MFLLCEEVEKLVAERVFPKPKPLGGEIILSRMCREYCQSGRSTRITAFVRMPSSSSRG